MCASAKFQSAGNPGNIDPLAGPEFFGTSHAVRKPAEHSGFRIMRIMSRQFGHTGKR